MKLAASQIGWAPGDEREALLMLEELGFTGLEIAPTRLVPSLPYNHPEACAAFAEQMRAEHGLTLCSLQSIWYGVSGNLFCEEREFLLHYTKQALRFAKAGGIGNLVFGCPRNRAKPEGADEELAVRFFREIAEEAAQNGAVLALEANPPEYNTNFMNATYEALDMARRVNSPGCRVNLDVGTMLINGEEVQALRGRVAEIHHVHVSEPGLAMIEERPLHGELAALLRQEGYAGWVSIEMREQPPKNLRRAAAYVAEVFQ